MAETKPDLAIVCAAPTEHAGHVEALAAHNVHVFVEKPFAGSVADARRMLHAMAGTGKLMAINWPLACYPCHVTCKRLIDEGLIGDLREVHFYDGNRGPLFHLAGKVEVTAAEVERQKPHYWWYKKTSGGGSRLDYLGFGATLGTWFMPRDSWLVDRANIQFGNEFYEKSIRGRAMFFEAAAEAETLEDLFHRLEDCGQLLRLDKDIWPTMYRCSTVTRAELAQLRRIENVVRLGRVTHLTAGEIVLADGTAPTPGPTQHIDCTADGLPNQPPRPIFEPNRITLQTVRSCQQTFSSSLIGHVEAAYDNDEVKNELCQVAPNPDNHVDWLGATLGTMTAQRRWAANKEMAQWLSTCRLDIFSSAAAQPGEISADTAEFLKRAGGKGGAALARLKALITEDEATAND